MYELEWAMQSFITFTICIQKLKCLRVEALSGLPRHALLQDSCLKKSNDVTWHHMSHNFSQRYMLRLLDTYAAKSDPPHTFSPIAKLLDHLSKICMTFLFFGPSGQRYQKYVSIWKVTSDGRAEIQNGRFCKIFRMHWILLLYCWCRKYQPSSSN